MRYDALIIGGGPAGATAALLLARAGWAVAVIEKSRFPRRKVCGEFVSATSMPVLRVLGLLDEFLERAGPEIRRVGLFARNVTLAAPMPQPALAATKWGRALGRERLDELVLQAAKRAGAALWQPWKAKGLRPIERGYECTIASAGDMRVLAAPVVIAAHGSWEHGTLPTQESTPHAPSDLLAFKAHFVDCDLPADLMPLLAFPGGYGGMVHSDGGRVSLTCCIRRDVLARCRDEWKHRHAADAVLHHIQSSCAGVRHALKRATLDHAWLSAGPIRPGIRDRYANGIFRVGNCAGEAHPVVAEGISMAMQSAALLCRLLIAAEPDVVAGRGIAEIGDRYAAEWKGLFAARIRAASVFANLAMSPFAAGVVLPFMRRFPQALTVGAHLSGKVKQVRAQA